MGEGDVVQVGVVGCGAIAQIVHLPILSRSEGAAVLAVCDTNFAKAETVADRFRIPRAYSSIDELLEHPGLHAVVVCTPNYLHAEHSERALQAGLDVLCERPAGITQEEVARLLASAAQTGRRLMVANSHRYRPDAWALRQSITQGELGEIFHVTASWQRRRARRPRISEWRRNREQAGGGVLMDLGVTNLDLCLWLLGYPTAERLTAYLVDRDEDGVEDSAVVLLRLEGSVTCSIEVSWDLAAIEDRHTLFALGSRGSGSLSPLVVHKETGGTVVDVTPRLAPGTENVFTAAYSRELDHFLAVVRGQSEAPLPGEQEMLMRIVDACYRSAEEGREIVL